MNLSTLLTKLDRLDEAEPLFRESLQFDPNFAQSHYKHGILLQKQKKTSPAVEELKKLPLLPPHIRSLITHSLAYIGEQEI